MRKVKKSDSGETFFHQPHDEYFHYPVRESQTRQNPIIKQEVSNVSCLSKVRARFDNRLAVV